MANTYPIRFPAQLRQHLRALRKKHGLTQANVAAVIGVSQARIAEIEANPSVVSFEQLMQLLSALGVTLTLCEASPLPDKASDESHAATTNTEKGRTLQPSGLSNGLPEEHKASEHAGNLSTLHTSSGSGAVLDALESIGGLDQARKALDARSRSNEIRKALESVGGLDQARKALEATSGSDAIRKALESVGGLDQARKALEASSDSDAIRRALESVGGLDQARKALEASSGSDAIRKAVESIGGLDQARKALEASSGSDAIRKALRDQDSLRSYRNFLAHSKKGNW